jgi:hypothetical protein
MVGHRGEGEQQIEGAYMNSAEEKLELAERELEHTKKALAAHLAVETKASADPAAYSAWQERRASLESEIQRSANLVSLASEEATAEKIRQAIAARDERNRANELLAKRLQQEGVPAVKVLLGLLHDLAVAAQEDARVNQRSFPDAARVASADALARSIPMQPREDLAEEIVELWVDARTGEVVGNQRDVVQRTSLIGVIGPWNRRCAKRKFRAIDYLEEVPVQRAPSIFTALKLPNLDGPGFAYDGDLVSHTGKALQLLSELGTGQRPSRDRQTLRQLIPVEPWVRPPEADELTANGRRGGEKAEGEG